MTYRPSAQLRELHDQAACPDPCPLCMEIDAHQTQPDETRDDRTLWHYPEGWAEP